MCVAPIPRVSGWSSGEGAWCFVSGGQEFACCFCFVNVEQKRLKWHRFPTLYRRERQHVLCIDSVCPAQHRGWMWDGRWGGSRSADWKRPPKAGTQTWVCFQLFWDSGWGLRLNQGSGKKTTISSEW